MHNENDQFLKLLLWILTLNIKDPRCHNDFESGNDQDVFAEVCKPLILSFHVSLWFFLLYLWIKIIILSTL